MAGISTFFRAYDGLSGTCASYPWGTVSRNPLLPHVWDANRAWIHGATSPSLAELQAAIARAQEELAVPYTQVEVIDTDARASLIEELRGWLDPSPECFVLMTTDRTAPAGPAADPRVVIVESPFPDPVRWLELIRAGHADEQLPAVVLEELAERDCGPLAAAGMRLLTARRGDEVGAFATLLSVQGIGLVDSVATLPHHRRQGLATSLIAAAIAASAAAGNHTTILFTREGGEAQRIYSRLGMRVVARVAQFHGEGPASAPFTAVAYDANAP
jgi:ribosomal protein S18 acetylase RimI-like enzyme